MAAVIAASLLVPMAAIADTTHWDFDLETEGQDVFWTSSTAVPNDMPVYDATYLITLVEVMVSYLGIPFGPFDVTDEIPSEYLSNSDTFAGPPPIVIMDGHLAYPEPPEPPSIEADIHMEIDAGGYGQMSITDVYLGEIDYDLGWPWGIVTVQIESIRMAGWVEVTPRLPGDLDDDGDVDQSDLGILLADWGCTGDCPGDVDGDGDTDQGDLGLLLAYWGW
jgi:hypothetical protein